MREEQQERRLALSNCTSRADGSDTPQSLLEGGADNQTVAQALVRHSAKGQMLGTKENESKTNELIKGKNSF